MRKSLLVKKMHHGNYLKNNYEKKNKANYNLIKQLNVKFGYSIPWSSLDDIILQSQIAEKNCFDTLWYSDHLMIPGNATVFESFSIIATLAQKTKSIKIGQPVVDTFRRHPSLIAHTALTIDNLSNGRSFVGLGAGEPMNLTPIGIRMKDSLLRLKESIEYIKGLWKADKKRPLNFNGKFFKAENLYLNIKKIQKLGPPIYLGASGPKTRQLAGQLADGWVPYVHSLSNYKQLLTDVKKGASKARRNHQEIDIVANIPVLILEKENDEQRNQVRRSLAIRLIMESNTLRDLGWGRNIPKEISQLNMVVNESINKKLEIEADKIPQDVAEQIAAIGTPSEVLETLESYRKMGVTHFLIKIMGKDLKESASKFKTKIISVMKEA